MEDKNKEETIPTDPVPQIDLHAEDHGVVDPEQEEAIEAQETMDQSAPVPSRTSFTLLQASEVYPPPELVRDGDDPTVAVPFPEIPGEFTRYVGVCTRGGGHGFACVLALSNYRLHWTEPEKGNCLGNLPLGHIDGAEIRDLTAIQLLTKDARGFRIQFDDPAYCELWHGRISESLGAPSKVEHVFAFAHLAWAREKNFEELAADLMPSHQNGNHVTANGTTENGEPPADVVPATHRWFTSEVRRLGFDLGSAWRKSGINAGFKMCATYPEWLVVPRSVSDEVLEKVFRFRSARRIPSVIWRSRKTGAVLARCSQPEVGWFGWRSTEDENMITAIARACALDVGTAHGGAGDQEQKSDNGLSMNESHFVALTESNSEVDGNNTTNAGSHSPESSDLEKTSNHLHRNGSAVVMSSEEEIAQQLRRSVSAGGRQQQQTGANGEKAVSNGGGSHGGDVEGKEEGNKKVLVMDARSYAAAVGNRARGGGVECAEYYDNTEILFMNLPNIHSIRKSFQALRLLCSSSSSSDQGATWFQSLEGTKWLQNMSGLLKAAIRCAQALGVEGRPVLVHCSDGWDRTPQITSLAQLLQDSYYRSFEGFQKLVEKDWLDYGHKMADRCGNAFACSDTNERSPIFLQWLDTVHQLLLQFPCSFEFNFRFLVKLAQHTYSEHFGTFLCNSLKERRDHRVYSQTRSFWNYAAFHRGEFTNHLYAGSREEEEDRALWPKSDVRDLLLWKEVYLSSEHGMPCSRKNSNGGGPEEELTAIGSSNNSNGVAGVEIKSNGAAKKVPKGRKKNCDTNFVGCGEEEEEEEGPMGGSRGQPETLQQRQQSKLAAEADENKTKVREKQKLFESDTTLKMRIMKLGIISIIL